jgi:hypothetical protein
MSFQGSPAPLLDTIREKLPHLVDIHGLGEIQSIEIREGSMNVLPS